MWNNCSSWPIECQVSIREISGPWCFGILGSFEVLESAVYRALLLLIPICYSGQIVLTNYCLFWDEDIILATSSGRSFLSSLFLTGSQTPGDNTRNPELCNPFLSDPHMFIFVIFSIIYWNIFEYFIKIYIYPICCYNFFV